MTEGDVGKDIIPADNGDDPDDDFSQELQDFFEYRRQELAVEKEKISASRHETEVNAETARRHIDASLQIDQNHKEYHLQANKNRTVILGGAVIAVFLFSIAALFLGKDQILQKIVEYAIVFVGGGGFGYAAGKKKRSSKDD